MVRYLSQLFRFPPKIGKIGLLMVWTLPLFFFAVSLCFASIAIGQTQGNFPSSNRNGEDLSLDLLNKIPNQNQVGSANNSELSLGSIGQPGEATNEEPWWKKNLRLTLDIAERPEYTEQTGLFSNSLFVGIDMHKVFTGPDGDWGTLTFQPYLTRIDNLQRHMPAFDDAHDWEMIWRISNFNYTKLARGKFNIRVGHAELPYGLEHVINTNGTLRDYTQMRNIGVKGDWGVTANGTLENHEYEVGLFRGSGNQWRRRDDPYLIAGRIGTSREKPIRLGLSALYGDVYQYGAATTTTRRSRIGLDLITDKGPFTILAEASLGRDPGTTVVNGVFELDWQNRNSTWLVYDQLECFNSDLATGWDTNLVNILGLRWTPDSHWALSGQWSQDITSFRGQESIGVFSLQARYRF